MPKKSIVPNVIPYELYDMEHESFPFLHNSDGQTNAYRDFVAVTANIFSTDLYQS